MQEASGAAVIPDDEGSVAEVVSGEPGADEAAERRLGALGTAETMREAAIAALMQSGKQSSAAEALEDAAWRVEGDSLRVQTGFSKAMLGMVLNPDAERIARAAIREAGGGTLRIEWLPGSPAEKKAVAKRAAKTGSAQAKAEGHPLVRQAQELFHAEIRKVIDLSGSK